MWLNFREDVKCWDSWNEKEEFMNKNGRSRTREADKIWSLDGRKDDDHRSRSRSRCLNHITPTERDRYRERYGINDERKRKEQVKWWWLCWVFFYNFVTDLCTERIGFVKSIFFSIHLFFTFTSLNFYIFILWNSRVYLIKMILISSRLMILMLIMISSKAQQRLAVHVADCGTE